MDGKSLNAAEDELEQRRVSTLELVFDLVFVFTLTQLTAQLEHELTLELIVQVALVFVVLFWIYGGYAWLTNQVPPNRTSQRLLIIASMTAFMITALSIPGAFGGTTLSFGIGYLLVVVIHAGLYIESAGIGVLRFLPLNLLGAFALIIASFVDLPWKYILWLVPIIFQYLTSTIVRRVQESTGSGFQVNPIHFVERHGLLLIVALGESVVATGIGLGGVRLDFGNYLAAALGVALTAAFWWVYFMEDAQRAESALTAASLRERVKLAINGYFYSYIPMLLGVVVFAAGVAHAISHVSERIDLEHASLLGAGASLYLLGNVGFRKVMDIQPTMYRTLISGAAIASLIIGMYLSAMAQLIALALLMILMFIAEKRASLRWS